MRIFQSGFGLWIDLDRVLLIREPFFLDQMGHGGYYIKMSICLQLSTICAELEDCMVHRACKVASCGLPDGSPASRYHGAVRLREDAPPQPNELVCDLYRGKCRGLRPEDMTPGSLRFLVGEGSDNNVAAFFKNYDELLAAWQTVPQYHAPQPPIKLGI